MLHKYAIKFGKLSSGHRTGKGQFSFKSLRIYPSDLLTQIQNDLFIKLFLAAQFLIAKDVNKHPSDVNKRPSI